MDLSVLQSPTTPNMYANSSFVHSKSPLLTISGRECISPNMGRKCRLRRRRRLGIEQVEERLSKVNHPYFFSYFHPQSLTQLSLDSSSTPAFNISAPYSSPPTATLVKPPSSSPLLVSPANAVNSSSKSLPLQSHRSSESSTSFPPLPPSQARNLTTRSCRVSRSSSSQPTNSKPQNNTGNIPVMASPLGVQSSWRRSFLKDGLSRKVRLR